MHISYFYTLHQKMVLGVGAFALLKKYLRELGYLHSPASDETDYLHCRNTVVTRNHIQYKANNTSELPKSDLQV